MGLRGLTMRAGKESHAGMLRTKRGPPIPADILYDEAQHLPVEVRHERQVPNRIAEDRIFHLHVGLHYRVTLTTDRKALSDYGIPHESPSFQREGRSPNSFYSPPICNDLKESVDSLGKGTFRFSLSS
jgi:hypothetical protein